MQRQLKGKVAIVTGGAAGFGEGIVRLFVAQGARVVIADLDASRGEKLAAELGEKHELSKKVSTEILTDLVALIAKNLKKGNKLRLTGLGILQVRKRPARMGRNPATGGGLRSICKRSKFATANSTWPARLAA